MQTDKKNTMLYVAAGLAVLLLVGAVWYTGGFNSTDNSEEEVGSTTKTAERANAGPETRTLEEIQAAEPTRQADIVKDRATLLTEQQALDALQAGTSTEDLAAQQAAAERKQAIELELLELKNQEEYPPLPNPGI